MSAGDITDRDAIEALRRLRKRSDEQLGIAVRDADPDVARHRDDVNALDRAMAAIGGNRGAAADGRTRVHFDRAELDELLALVADEDGDADEQLLDRCEHRLRAALRRLDSQQGGTNQ